MKKRFKVLLILGMAFSLFYLTLMNVKIAYSCYIGGCEDRMTDWCDFICSIGPGCGGIMLTYTWCCPLGTTRCCSEWYIVCEPVNGRFLWGKYTCISSDSSCMVLHT